MNNKITQIEQFVKEKLGKDSSGHDWWHAHRVRNNAKKIAEGENADSFIVEAAALLHDLADYKIVENETVGLKDICDFLVSIEVDEEQIRGIIEAIKSIDFKGAGVDTTPETIEGKVIQDADRLDALGAIGIARAMAYGGFRNRLIHNPDEKPTQHQDFADYKKRTSSSINHFYEKLLLLKDCMNTETGKAAAGKRHEYMEKYLKQFYLEWDGEDIITD